MNYIEDVLNRFFYFWPGMASKKRKLNDGGEGFTCFNCDARATENEALSQRIQQLEQMFEQEKREKENALMRLSADMSSRLRDNNPNIADLSDPNRPTKLAEQFSELYDNEWTDAYDVLEKSEMDEKKIISKLFNVLLGVYVECMKLTNEDFFERVQHCIVYPEQIRPIQALHVPLAAELRQKVKEFRKQKAPLVVPDIAKFLKGRVVLPMFDDPTMNRYFEKCVEFCWLACVQDPPLVLDAEPVATFDKDRFKDYTKRGPYVEYIVWPALRLHENGPLLSKGVAQGSDSFTFLANPIPAAVGHSPPRPMPAAAVRKGTPARPTTTRGARKRTK